MMLTVSLVFSVLLISAVVGRPQDESPNVERDDKDDACIQTPCGPDMCRARCVASCLDTDLASNIDDCNSNYCQNFDDNTPCPLNDTACWKTCGFISSSDDPPSPSSPDDLRLGFSGASADDGYSTANANPKLIRVEWSPSEDTTLYIVEAYPMFGKDPSENTEHIVKNMTTDTRFEFARADLCNAYMIRVIAVNGFGTSSPRYLIVDAWKPELHFDENFDVRFIRRENDYVKVQIDYTPPEYWRPDDAQFENSYVRAHDCLGPLDEDIFVSTQPDEDGFYIPLVFVNETEKSIELNLPAKIMESKCLFSYRISSLRTSCNASIQLNTKTGPGVDFALNCLSVDNSNCLSTSDENNDESSSAQNNTSIEDSSNLGNDTSSEPVVSKADSTEVLIVLSPEAIKELEEESTTTASETTVVVTTGDSESSQEETTTAAVPAEENAEMAVVGVPEALQELQEDPGSESTTSAVDSTTVEMDTTTMSAEVAEESPENSGETVVASPPSPMAEGGDNEASPAVVIVEPLDPNAPLCKLIEFDAELETQSSSSGSSEDQPLTLTLTWLEDKPADMNGPNPSHFLVRYGPVARTLIVDPQPEILDETIVRTPQADSSSEEEVSRKLKITDLSSNALYAFQICAIYNPAAELAAAWDMVPRHVLDLSAANALWRSLEKAIEQAPKPLEGEAPPTNEDDGSGSSGKGEPDFVESFIEALNSNFNAAEEAAADSVKTYDDDQSDSTTTTQSAVDTEANVESAPASSSSEEKERGSSSSSEEALDGIFQINIPPPPPPVFNVNVKPILITTDQDANGGGAWSSGRAMWLFLGLILLAVSMSTFMFAALRRSRNRKCKKQSAITAPIYYTHTSVAQPTPVQSDVKIPIS